jgi:hypothetical protein
LEQLYQCFLESISCKREIDLEFREHVEVSLEALLNAVLHIEHVPSIFNQLPNHLLIYQIISSTTL